MALHCLWAVLAIWIDIHARSKVRMALGQLTYCLTDYEATQEKRTTDEYLQNLLRKLSGHLEIPEYECAGPFWPRGQKIDLLEGIF